MLNTLIGLAQVVTAVAALWAVYAALSQARIARDALREQHEAGRENNG
jgi:hypothetical protein